MMLIKTVSFFLEAVGNVAKYTRLARVAAI